MADAKFDTYFHERARRFASFYRSEPVARLLGRGALFERLRHAVDIAVERNAHRVLDVGCGSGPLFAPLAERGIHVTGIDPAPGMVALARTEARRFPELVKVEQCSWEQIQGNGFDLAVALGVFDYVGNQAGDLLRRMTTAAPVACASFPYAGLRVGLRKMRYGLHGVNVRGYDRVHLEAIASDAGVDLVEVRPLERAGLFGVFARVGD